MPSCGRAVLLLVLLSPALTSISEARTIGNGRSIGGLVHADTSKVSDVPSFAPTSCVSPEETREGLSTNEKSSGTRKKKKKKRKKKKTKKMSQPAKSQGNLEEQYLLEIDGSVDGTRLKPKGKKKRKKLKSKLRKPVNDRHNDYEGGKNRELVSKEEESRPLQTIEQRSQSKLVKKKKLKKKKRKKKKKTPISLETVDREWNTSESLEIGRNEAIGQSSRVGIQEVTTKSKKLKTKKKLKKKRTIKVETTGPVSKKVETIQASQPMSSVNPGVGADHAQFPAFGVDTAGSTTCIDMKHEGSSLNDEASPLLISEKSSTEMNNVSSGPAEANENPVVQAPSEGVVSNRTSTVIIDQSKTTTTDNGTMFQKPSYLGKENATSPDNQSNDQESNTTSLSTDEDRFTSLPNGETEIKVNSNQGQLDPADPLNTLDEPTLFPATSDDDKNSTNSTDIPVGDELEKRFVEEGRAYGSDVETTRAQDDDDLEPLDVFDESGSRRQPDQHDGSCLSSTWCQVNRRVPRGGSLSRHTNLACNTILRAGELVGDGENTSSSAAPTQRKTRKNDELLRNPRVAIEQCLDKDSDIVVSVLTWNLAEESPEEDDVEFMKRLRKLGLDGKGADIVMISGQECENIKPRRKEGRRSREFRRLMVQMLGKRFVPVALHSLGGIQLALFCRRSLMDDLEHVSVADVTCGIGNVIHNKGAIAAFVQMKARNQLCDDSSRRAKSVKMLFVSAHLAAHVKNVDARDADYLRIMTELEGQAPAPFLKNRPGSFDLDSGGRALLNAMDRVFFCGDLNYRLDLPRELVEHSVSEMSDHTKTNEQIQHIRTNLLKHDQLRASIADRRAFVGFKEGNILFQPTFKFDKDSTDYDTSHKQRIPAWTDRILFTPRGTRVLEYDSIPQARHSDHRPVLATFRVNSHGRKMPERQRKNTRKGRLKKSNNDS